jgi:hypothetical protein
MSLPEIVSRDEWIRARVALLEREKALSKARDELAAERRRLPVVEVTEGYRFTAADGSSPSLLDLYPPPPHDGAPTERLGSVVNSQNHFRLSAAIQRRDRPGQPEALPTPRPHCRSLKVRHLRRAGHRR